jgi:hypothetical protein
MHMEWVDRLASATGWDSAPGEADWTATEAALGTPLPDDFKELSRRFAVRGAFCDYLMLLGIGTDPDSLSGNHGGLLGRARANPGILSVYRPYRLFGGAGSEPGLLQWGFSELEDEYYWLADVQTDPARWPVVAREDPLEPFHRLDMAASEFVHRALTDRDFRPFTIAHKTGSPYFEAY